MKTEQELNADILKVTMIIRDKYPELSKYISEMTVTIPDVETPDINIKNLNDYHDSLVAILKRYAPSHISEI
jgi:hypothetical protein